MTIVQIQSLRAEFVKRYRQGKRKHYITGSGIKTIGLCEWSKQGSKVSLERCNVFLEKAGRNPWKLCLMVYLSRKLPKNLALPIIYKGMKIYTRVIEQSRTL